MTFSLQSYSVFRQKKRQLPESKAGFFRLASAVAPLPLSPPFALRMVEYYLLTLPGFLNCSL
jgi:hypothetical protein